MKESLEEYGDSLFHEYCFRSVNKLFGIKEENMSRSLFLSFKYELGEVLRDVVSGFEGVTMGRTQYFTDCNHYGLGSRQLDKDGKPVEWQWFDETRLISSGKKKIFLSPVKPTSESSSECAGDVKMKRSRQVKSSSPPTAILTADWHIRPTAPVCRTDDFLAAMWKKVEFVLDLAVEHCCPILMAGDIGLKSQWPNWLLEEFIRKVSQKEIWGFYAIPGQHDLPNHQLNQWREAAIGVLHEAKSVIFLGTDGDGESEGIMLGEKKAFNIYFFPYGIEIKNPSDKNDLVSPPIAIAHTLVTERAPEEFLTDKARSAISLLQKFPEYNLILTGDNHKSFVVEHEGRLLVNPGSLMRTAADQVDHKPRVYLWYAQENRVEPIYLPIEEGVISRDHIDNEEEKDQRIQAYINRLSEEVEIGLSFEGNLEAYFRQNRIRKPVIDKVWASMPK